LVDCRDGQMGFLSWTRAAGESCLRCALGSAVTPREPCAHVGSFETNTGPTCQTETKLGREGGQGLL
jgi:hypothetical protein